MSGADDDHERTMAFAEIAFGQIKALRQPASPRHFEIWYTYATGYNPSLNQMINEILSRNGTLTEADVDNVYETCISPNRFTDRIDHVGSQVREKKARIDIRSAGLDRGLNPASSMCSFHCNRVLAPAELRRSRHDPTVDAPPRGGLQNRASRPL